MSKAWTFDGYWAVVLGANRSADDVVREFDLDPADRRGVDEWLGNAEAEALAMGGESNVLADWTEFHGRALEALCNA